MPALSPRFKNAGAASNDDIRELAELMCRPKEENDRSRPFPREAQAAVEQMVRQWGERLIASGDNATRAELAAVGHLIGYFPTVAMLPMLKRLLDEELRRYKAFRQQAEVEGWRGDAASEARTWHMNRYQEAFTAIMAPETTAIMISYLLDDHFGETASIVLLAQWLLANEPRDERRLWGGVDFSTWKKCELREPAAPRPPLTKPKPSSQ